MKLGDTFLLCLLTMVLRSDASRANGILKSPLSEEASLIRFLSSEYEPKARKICNNHVRAEWEHSLDLSDKRKQETKINATLQAAQFDKEYWRRYFRHLNPSDYRDLSLRRQVRMLRQLGRAALGDGKFIKLSSTVSDMMNIYSTAKICPYLKNDCNLNEEGKSLNPDIEAVMASSTDYEELLYTWKAWRDVTGRKMKDQYKAYVGLSNEVAKANNFSDRGAMWRSKFESETFEHELDRLWQEVKPLYDELHRYVLNKLKSIYGNRLEVGDGLIPAHILGNMWAQNWINVAKLVRPYPDAPKADLTNALVKRRYTPLKMFQVGDDFYQSLGLPSTANSYNAAQGAVIEKPPNTRAVCHASAWDFCDGKDFRIKMCTKVNFEDFVTVHHEMGHIQYYMLYKNQPITLRKGANPGFHEAIGDTIALSASSPTHLRKLGLISGNVDPKANLNSLMDMALERIAFLPFGLMVDKWRWDVFSGRIPVHQWNSHWWHYRATLQKIKPPVSRSDGLDFDPGSKFHIAADSQYISYFVAHILEFQLYKALCIEAGHYNKRSEKPSLQTCDFYGSKAAGNKLRAGLSMGASRHWREVLKKITGETELSGGALLEYFEPLYDFLVKANRETPNA